VFVTAGAHYIAVDFIDVGKADGNLMTMADQVRRSGLGLCERGKLRRRCKPYLHLWTFVRRSIAVIVSHATLESP
jgi:hypothetical protein